MDKSTDKNARATCLAAAALNWKIENGKWKIESRQQLQVLRDLGLVEFLGPGEYRLDLNWKIEIRNSKLEMPNRKFERRQSRWKMENRKSATASSAAGFGAPGIPRPRRVPAGLKPKIENGNSKIENGKWKMENRKSATASSTARFGAPSRLWVAVPTGWAELENGKWKIESRQQLQVLRDLGLVEFLGPGEYRLDLNWKIEIRNSKLEMPNRKFERRQSRWKIENGNSKCDKSKSET